jgi:hypothetical protein
VETSQAEDGEQAGHIVSEIVNRLH